MPKFVNGHDSHPSDQDEERQKQIVMRTARYLQIGLGMQPVKDLRDHPEESLRRYHHRELANYTELATATGALLEASSTLADRLHAAAYAGKLVLEDAAPAKAGQHRIKISSPGQSYNMVADTHAVTQGGPQGREDIFTSLRIGGAALGGRYVKLEYALAPKHYPFASTKTVTRLAGKTPQELSFSIQAGPTYARRAGPAGPRDRMPVRYDNVFEAASPTYKPDDGTVKLPHRQFDVFYVNPLPEDQMLKVMTQTTADLQRVADQIPVVEAE